MKSGFAFVEFMLLITTTIIIAAVLTVFLVTHSKSAKLAPMLTKTISSVKQSAMMAKAQYDYDFSDTDMRCPEDKHLVKELVPDENHSFCAIFNSTLKEALFRGKVSDIKYYKNGIILSYVLYERDVLPPDYRDFLAYTLKDGTIIAFNKNATGCSREDLNHAGIDTIFDFDSDNPLSSCIGFIDVNGTEAPNKEISCSKGENAIMESSDCVVDMREKHMRDVFPVVFYDSSVEPATAAGKFVMSNKKG